jgi:trimethylamine-N-oxide reductase (cytochrome c)
MSLDEKEPKVVSRRFFIKGAAVGAAVAGASAIAGCTTTPTPAPTGGPAPTQVVVVKEVVKEVPGAATGAIEPAFEPEESFVIPVGGNNSETAVVDVKNGKIVRIKPLHYDWKYTKEELAPARWKIEARGKTFEPRMQSLISYFAAGYKKRVYSPNRVLYPLKRVDWEPGGVNVNPQNRGKSKYKRITWDEAATIVAGEIKRVQDKYGHLGLFVGEQGPHVEKKTVHKAGGWHRLLMAKTAGCTNMNRNSDSWEGWYWGAMHVWGTGSNGEMTPNGNMVLGIAQSTDMLVWQGGDPETTAQEMGQYSSRLLYWFTELGIKQVWITPDLNYSAAIHADKWIPVLPNTDAALQMAVIYTWLKEDTYDKAYVATHTVGFDKIKAYIMGDEDGVPKTPAWASPKCGIPEWTIKALAREWAAKRTSTAHYVGGWFHPRAIQL